MIVIISCGAKKQDCAARAIDIYTGSYFQALRKWALSVTNERNIYILSAKYGLLPASKTIKPYNLKMGSAGCVTAEHVAAQARALRIDKECPVVVAGQDYLKVARKVWATLDTPFATQPDGIVPKQHAGMGYQMQYLKNYRGQIPRRQQ
jgi:hypothetical protein